MSREHAIVWQASDGNHYPKPVAKDRLVAVNGQFIDRPCRLEERTELQVGNVLLVFSQQMTPAGVASYQRTPMYSDSVGKKKGADIELTGFQMGGNDEIRWEHGRYVIEHNMRRPSMTVNGESVNRDASPRSPQPRNTNIQNRAEQR